MSGKTGSQGAAQGQAEAGRGIGERIRHGVGQEEWMRQEARGRQGLEETGDG